MAVTHTATDLRPLGIGGILDAGFKIYKARFKTLALCVLVPVVPLAIVNVLLTASTTENGFDPTAPVEPEGTALTGTLISGLLSLLMAMLALAACTRAVAGAYSGEEITWRASLRAAVGKLAPLIGAVLLTILAVLVGFMLLIIPGIYLMFRLAVVVPAVIVEDLGPDGAVKRSWKLVGGRWWATFAIVASVSILVTIIAGILQGLILTPVLAGNDSELVGGVLSGLGEVVTNVFTLPLQAAVITVLYFDLRVRKEGLDLERLTEQISDGPGVPGGGSPADARVARDYGGFAPPLARRDDSTGIDSLRPPEERGT